MNHGYCQGGRAWVGGAGPPPPPQMNPAEPIVNMLLRGQRDPKYVDPVGQGVLSYSILEQLLWYKFALVTYQQGK